MKHHNFKLHISYLFSLKIVIKLIQVDSRINVSWRRSQVAVVEEPQFSHALTHFTAPFSLSFCCLLNVWSQSSDTTDVVRTKCDVRWSAGGSSEWNGWNFGRPLQLDPTILYSRAESKQTFRSVWKAFTTPLLN